MPILNMIYWATWWGGWWWTPWTWCVAYYPFDTDTNDAVWTTTFTVISSWVGLSTVDGITALYNNGSGYSNINIWFSTASATSVFFWFRFVSGSDKAIIGQRSTSWGDSDRMLYNRTNYTPYWLAYSRYPATDIYSGVALTSWTWICIWLLETSSWANLYINWNLVGNASWSESFSNLTWNIWILCRKNNNSYERAICWYMSKLSIYNAEKSEADYLAFYNWTKAEYGL